MEAGEQLDIGLRLICLAILQLALFHSRLPTETLRSKATASGLYVLRERRSSEKQYRVYIARGSGKLTKRLLRLPVRPYDSNVEDRIAEHENFVIAFINNGDIFRTPYFLIRRGGFARMATGWRFGSDGVAGNHVISLNGALCGTLSHEAPRRPQSYVYRFGPRGLSYGKVKGPVTDIESDMHGGFYLVYGPWTGSATYKKHFRSLGRLREGSWTLG